MDDDEDDIERAAVEEILKEARKIGDSTIPPRPVICVNKRLLSSTLVSTLRNPIFPKSVKKRRHIGLDDKEDEDTEHDAQKRPDDGYDYDPSADYIYDARQYFDPNKYREIVKTRNRAASKLEKRQKLRALRCHYKPHEKYEQPKNHGYKSKDNGNERVLQFNEYVEQDDECDKATLHKEDQSPTEEFDDINASLNCTDAASIRHKAKHKHKKRKSKKKSSKHSILSSSPIGAVSKAHRKHSMRKTEKDFEHRHKKKKRHKRKCDKSKTKSM